MFAASTRTVDGRPVRRRRPEPPREHPLLALQSGAGNAAVTRMLQRKIGFELESGQWQSAALADEPTEEHRSKKAIPKSVKTKPPAAREKFYESGGIRGTADELPGGVRDVEFVIVERDEADSKGIASAFDQVEELYGQIDDAREVDHWVWPEAKLGWKPPTGHTWLLDNPADIETHVQLQATAGIPLQQLAETAARLDDNSPHQDATLWETGIHPAAAEAVIVPSYDLAVFGLEDYASRYGEISDAGALTGMLTLMAQFLLGGTPEVGEEKEAAYSYPKAIAAILPRTDFAALFGTLPEPLREELKTVDKTTGRRRFTELIGMMAARTPVGGLDRPVFSNEAWKQIDDTLIVPDLTRQAWADGILDGQDRITKSGYREWLNTRREAIGELEYGKRRHESKQLDSIGGYHDRTDEGPGEEKLPLVEFRALADAGNKGIMTLPEAKRVGVLLAAYVDKLVKRSL